MAEKVLNKTKKAMEKSWDKSLGDFFDTIRELSKRGELSSATELRINTAVYDMSEKVRDLIYGQEPL